MAAAKLQVELTAIWASVANVALPAMASENRKVLMHGVAVAVRTAFAGPAAGDEVHSDCVDDLDFALDGLRRLRGGASPWKVEDAKRWLREQGGNSIASLLGKLSKGRNIRSHPLARRIVAEA